MFVLPQPWWYTGTMAMTWNRVTWYSKLLAVALFMGIFGWGFYLGASYGVAVGELKGRTDTVALGVSNQLPKLCTMTATKIATAYMRPSAEASVFGTVPAGEVEVLGGRTAEGWLGFDPGVAQAPNVGPFRLRWLAPGSPVVLGGGCAHLPLWPTLPPRTCFTMAEAQVSVYQVPGLTSPAVTQMSFGDYLQVTARAVSGSQVWLRVQSPLGTLPAGTAGWLPQADVNFNGDCDRLPVVKG